MTDSPHAGQVHAQLASVAHELSALERALLSLETEMAHEIARVAKDRQDSARNLVHYVALRQRDLRALQIQLAQLGLSSLTHSESCVLGSMLEVSLRAHEVLAQRGDVAARRALPRLQRARDQALSWDAAKYYLHQHTRDLLGPHPADRHIHIMVTAPSAKEAERSWMVRMLKAGMNVLRINCAHEDAAAWGALARALVEARKETGKECRILMDLAGPKIRTGPIEGGRCVGTWKPQKDDLGRVKSPARVPLVPASEPWQDGSPPELELSDEDHALLRKGDELVVLDARGKKRVLVVQDARVASAAKRIYVEGEVRARVLRDGRTVARVRLRVRGAEGAAVDVRRGDSLVLRSGARKGRPPRRDAAGNVLRPGAVSCTLPAALEHLDVGHRVLIDDGKLHCVVVRKKKGGDFLLSVQRMQKETVKLHAEKGINLPDTVTSVPSLTEDDLRALPSVVEHADAVGLSFVRTPDDVHALHTALTRAGRPDLGVVLKIETRAGFENLPRLLLAGLRRPQLAIMIARGDLAVEIGFERLAEVQEEILWLCEASHVPVVWATQVLDTMARTGVPSRAEVTDAAASVAAECVMLNKGPFVDEAVAVLSDILRRMEQHHYKKRGLFRRLRVSTFAAR